MTASPPKQIVAIVLSAIEAKRSDSEIAQELISLGFNPSDAPSVLNSIRVGFQSGVQSIIMGTGSQPNSDDFYHEAFARGRAAMRFTTPGWVLVRMLAPYVIGGIILAFLVWRFVL